MMRLGQDRSEVRVVSDQFGNPTSALDIAQGILAVTKNLVAHPADGNLRGTFHMSGRGEGSWADFAEEIFRLCASLGEKAPTVSRITTAEYPTPARRPSNSRLDCTKLQRVHGVSLPDWRSSTETIVSRLINHGT
jgi:dTDP-4-dehydrorhamnose reductase